MDLEAYRPGPELGNCCDCGCSYCSDGAGSAQLWNRAVKRKTDGVEVESGVVIPGLSHPAPPIVRVQIENECDALREIVYKQQESIQDLFLELEEERNSSSTAANETMSMILRLQRDKSEIQMEARQFKGYAEEKMAHDQQEISALEDLLYRREQVIQSLTCEIQAYKHRMLSFGLTESEIENGDYSLSQGGQFEFPLYEYPPLRCFSNEVNRVSEVENDFIDTGKCSFDGTPHSIQHLKNLDLRISQMERSPRHSEIDVDSPAARSVIEKVVVGQSRMMHTRKFSVDSSNSLFGYGKESLSHFPSESPRFGSSFKKIDHVEHTHGYSNARRMDNPSEAGDFMKDRLHTVDPVYNKAPCTTPMESLYNDEYEDPEIKKLYIRLQALEAERDSMRQTLISMRSDKAQLVLLKEIAQQLCKDITPERRMPMRKPSIFKIFPFAIVFQLVASIVFWRKGANQSKYTFGSTASNMGLLMLLDRGPGAKPWRCLTRSLV